MPQARTEREIFCPSGVSLALATRIRLGFSLALAAPGGAIRVAGNGGAAHGGARQSLDLDLPAGRGERMACGGSQNLRVVSIGNDHPAPFGKVRLAIEDRRIEMNSQR